MKIGDRRTVKPVCFEVAGANGKPTAITGTAVYVHPEGRFCVLEFEVGRRESVTLRESFKLIKGEITE